MAIIEKEVKLAGSKGERKVVAIFDSGSTYSCIQPELAKELEMIVRLPEPMDFGTAKEGERLTATEGTRLNFYLDGYRFSDEFMLIQGLSEPVIIGAKTLQAWRLKLNFETDEVIIDPRVTKLRLLPIIYQIISKEVTPMGKSQRESVVRGFSLVHDPEGSHYILEGNEESPGPGQGGVSLRPVVTLSEAKGLEMRDSSPRVQNDKGVKQSHPKGAA